jgi:hypothetical protein
MATILPSAAAPSPWPASGKVSNYPQVRAVTLTALPTRLIADAAFGEYDKNEMRYAQELIEWIPEQSLTVFDKGFFSASLLLGLTLNGEQRHFLIPAKAKARWEVISGSKDDALVQMKVSPQARAKNPGFPAFWTACAIRAVLPDGSEKMLLTSLIAYNLVRLEMAKATVEAKAQPSIQ